MCTSQILVHDHFSPKMVSLEGAVASPSQVPGHVLAYGSREGTALVWNGRGCGIFSFFHDSRFCCLLPDLLHMLVGCASSAAT